MQKRLLELGNRVLDGKEWAVSVSNTLDDTQKARDMFENDLDM